MILFYDMMDVISMSFAALYSAALYSSVLIFTVPYFTVLIFTVLLCVVQVFDASAGGPFPANELHPS